MTLAAWFHDIDPIIVRIAGDFAVRWYGVAYAIGFLLGWWQMAWLARRGGSMLNPLRIPDVMMAMIFGVVLGGRLGYVLIYQRPLLWTFDGAFPFWGVLMINKGGMSFHGAMIGLMIAAWFVARGAKTPDGGRANSFPVLHMFDLIAFIAPVGLMLGRIANFVNGELLGRVVAKPGAPSPWWAVQFPQEILSGHPVEYTAEQSRQLDQILGRFGLGTVPEGRVLDRLLDAIHHGSATAQAALKAELIPLLSARHASQLYQAFAEGPVLGLILWIVWARPRRPGVVASAFLIAYGILRVVIEQFFRLPDPGDARVMGLSRGQWLSSGMVLAGVFGLILIQLAARARRGSSWDIALGGWLRPRTGGK